MSMKNELSRSAFESGCHRLCGAAALVALRTFVSLRVGWGEQRPGRAAGSASPRRPAKCAGSPAMLGPVAPSRTHCACCARSVQTSAPSPEHEARCARGHAPCASRRRRGAAPATRPGLCGRQWAYSTSHSPRPGVAARIATDVCKAAAGRRAQRLCGGEEHSEQGRARSALRDLTRRGWSSEVNAVNEASSATGPVSEHRSAVRPTGGPPQRSGERRPAAALPAPTPRTLVSNVRNAPQAEHPGRSLTCC